MEQPKYIYYQNYTKDGNWYWSKPTLDTSQYKLPEKIKVSKTFREDLKEQGAKYCAEGPTKNGKRTFFTGLRPTSHPLYFYGDGINKAGNKCLVLLGFNKDYTKLNTMYFNGFYKYNDKLNRQFIESYLMKITNKFNGR